MDNIEMTCKCGKPATHTVMACERAPMGWVTFEKNICDECGRSGVYGHEPGSVRPEDEEPETLCELCGRPATHTITGFDETPTDRGILREYCRMDVCSECDPPRCSGCGRPAEFCRCP